MLILVGLGMGVDIDGLGIFREISGVGFKP